MGKMRGGGPPPMYRCCIRQGSPWTKAVHALAERVVRGISSTEKVVTRQAAISLQCFTRAERTQKSHHGFG